MNPAITHIALWRLPHGLAHFACGCGPLLSKVGIAITIACAFVRAVSNPDEPFSTIAFWLLLFIGAATRNRDGRLTPVENVRQPDG